MIRFCNGRNVGTVGPLGKTPCDCGATFDDRLKNVEYPHRLLNPPPSRRRERQMPDGELECGCITTTEGHWTYIGVKGRDSRKKYSWCGKHAARGMQPFVKIPARRKVADIDDRQYGFPDFPPF